MPDADVTILELGPPDVLTGFLTGEPNDSSLLLSTGVGGVTTVAGVLVTVLGGV